MPTQRQRKAVEKMAENGGNVSKAMREAGYSPISAATPKKLTESKGFKELCDELGLTDNLIVTALVEDIKASPGQRSKELALAIKVKGLEKTNVDLTSNGNSLEPIMVQFINAADNPDTD